VKTLRQLSDLSGRRALITGGAGQVALAATQALLELGASVVLLDRDVRALGKRAESLGRPDGLRIDVCDLENEAKTRRTLRTVLGKDGGLDILIHCAAYTGAMRRPGAVGSLAKQTAAAMEASLRVNLTAALVLVQELGEPLARSDRGSVILFSSIYGLVGPDLRLYEGTAMSNSAGYNAAKGGIIQLTRYFATTMAPKVRVNAISPGGIWRSQPEAFHRRYKARTPLGRMAVEEDLKGAIAYLASDLSSYVTGHNLAVDGGWTAW
jgi:NAD(P)-dependent dehydrogenase (short-subunit alcohol dehydrogenase family)